jgi:hypothetical protein
MPQLQALKVLTEHAEVIPAYGKILTIVAAGLVALRWAEFSGPAGHMAVKGYAPIKITELGLEILQRFESWLD